MSPNLSFSFDLFLWRFFTTHTKRSLTNLLIRYVPTIGWHHHQQQQQQHLRLRCLENKHENKKSSTGCMDLSRSPVKLGVVRHDWDNIGIDIDAWFERISWLIGNTPLQTQLSQFYVHVRIGGARSILARAGGLAWAIKLPRGQGHTDRRCCWR